MLSSLCQKGPSHWLQLGSWSSVAECCECSLYCVLRVWGEGGDVSIRGGGILKGVGERGGIMEGSGKGEGKIIY